MGRMQWRMVLLTFGLLWLQPGLAQTWPENGWWLNPAESGRGFYIEQQGSVLFMAAYFYDADGRPTWLISAGAPSDPMHYTGPLFAVSGGQTLVGDYKAPVEVDAGEVSLDFSDRTHGTMTWPGGTIPIERQIWDRELSAFNPDGWWWNPDQSGRGYAIEVQGDTLVMAAFMYDDQGKPVWYLTFGPMTTPTHFEGVWSKFSNGQTMSGPYKAPDETQFGSVTIDWATKDEATLTLSDESPSPKAMAAKKKQVVPIKRELPRVPTPPPPAWPSTWFGPFSQHYFFDASGDDALVKGTLHLHGNATWHENPLAPLTGGSAYSLVGSVEMDWDWKVQDSHTSCSGGHYEAVSLSGGDGVLNLGADGAYSGQIKRDLPFTWSQTCITCDEDGCKSMTKETTFDSLPLDIPLGGVVSNYTIEGTKQLPGFTYTTIWVNWDFVPRPW